MEERLRSLATALLNKDDIRAVELIHEMSLEELSTELEGYKSFVHIAASKNNKIAVMLLLKKGVAFDEVDKDGKTPLHLAACWEDVIYLLASAGADLTLTDNDGNTVLHLAADRGSEKTVSFLAKQVSDINQSNAFGLTPLHLAAGNGYEKAVLCLAQAGAELNSRHASDITPLSRARSRLSSVSQREYSYPQDRFAKQRAFKATILRLVEAGANFNRSDFDDLVSNQDLASFIRGGRDFFETKKLVLTMLVAAYKQDQRDNIDPKSADGLFSQIWQRMGEFFKDTNRVLAADIFQQINLICSGREISVAKGSKFYENRKESIDLIQEIVGRINGIKNQRDTLLQGEVQRAQRDGPSEQVQRLARIERDLDRILAALQPSESKDIAKDANHEEDVALRLVDQMSKDELVCKGNFGMTALHNAVRCNQSRVVLSLISRLSVDDLNITDDRGKSAFSYVTRKTNPDIILSLIIAGADIDIDELPIVVKGEGYDSEENRKLILSILIALYERDQERDIDVTSEESMFLKVKQNIVNSCSIFDMMEGSKLGEYFREMIAAVETELSAAPQEGKESSEDIVVKQDIDAIRVRIGEVKSHFLSVRQRSQGQEEEGDLGFLAAILAGDGVDAAAAAR